MAEEGGAQALLGEEQRQALAYLSVRLHAAGFAISLLFFACSCMLIGVLILRSWLLPHAIGAMMVVAGACYLVNSLVYVAAPALSDVLVPWILLPCFLGELLLASWLAVKGVSVAAPEARRPLGRAPSSS
jgi:Domain of unknown function (DUF4386)